MIDVLAPIWSLVIALGSWYVWLILNYVQVSPLAALSLICGATNYYVNRKLWKIDSIEHEWNPIHRWFMGRFGVDKGMKLGAIIFSSVAISSNAIPILMMASPQYFLQRFLMLSVPPLVIASPLAVVVLVNDYYWLRRLERDVVTFKVL